MEPLRPDSPMHPFFAVKQDEEIMICNRKTFGRLMGRSPACVTKWIKRGMPVTPTGVDFEQARDWVLKNVPSYPGFGAAPGVTPGAPASPGVVIEIDNDGEPNHRMNGASNYTYVDLMRERVSVQIEREKLRLEREKDNLLTRSEHETIVIGSLAWYCGERRSLPSRICDELVGKSAVEIQQILERELNACQNELSRRLRVDPSTCDHLAKAWIAFYNEWRKERSPGS